MDTPKNNRVFSKMYMMFLKQYWEDYIAATFGENPTKDQLLQLLDNRGVRDTLINQVSDAIQIVRFGKNVSIFFLAKFIISLGEDILDYGDLMFWTGGGISGIPNDDVVEYLSLLGVIDDIYDKFINFDDIEFNGDEKVIWYLDNGWESFKSFFLPNYDIDNHGIKSILNPNFDAPIVVYFTSHYDKETMMDMLDIDSLNKIKKKFVNDVDYVGGIGFREEFNHYGYNIVEDDEIDIKKHTDTIMSIDDPYTFLVLIENSKDVVDGGNKLKEFKEWLSDILSKAYNRCLKSFYRPKLISEIIDIIDPDDIKVVDEDNNTEKLIVDTTSSFYDFINLYIAEYKEIPTDNYDSFTKMVTDIVNYGVGKFNDIELPDLHGLSDDEVKRFINQYIKINVN